MVFGAYINFFKTGGFSFPFLGINKVHLILLFYLKQKRGKEEDQH